MAEPLHACGFAGRALCGVHAPQFVSEVEDVRRLRGQRGQLVCPATTRTGSPLGSTRSTADPTDGSPAAVLVVVPGGVGQAQHVDLVRVLNAVPTNRDAVPRRRITQGAPASVPRSCSSSAVRSTVAKPKACGERLGASQVGLLELQPGDVGDLDDRIARPSGVLPGERALLAVQVVVGCRQMPLIRISSCKVDEIVTYDDTLSQVFLTKSSKLMISCYREGVTEQSDAPVNRLERRKQRTRARADQGGAGVHRRGQGQRAGPGDHPGGRRRDGLVLQPLREQGAAVRGRRRRGARLPRRAAGPADRRRSRTRRDLRVQLPADRPVVPATPPGKPDPAVATG